VANGNAWIVPNSPIIQKLVIEKESMVDMAVNIFNQFLTLL
jgi:hypothetical protein